MQSDDTAAQEEQQHARRKGRGPTRATSLQPPDGETWKLVIENGQMTSSNQKKLTRLMGFDTRSKECFPFHLQWRQYSPTRFTNWFNEIKKKYEFITPRGSPVNDKEAMRALKPALQNIIRDNRCSYKQKYFDGKSKEELVSCPISTMSPDAWKKLVTYWREENIKEMSIKNKVNRAKMKSTHTLGSKPLSRFYAEERSDKGDNFNIFESYLIAHMRKDGTYPNESTQMKCTKVAEASVACNISASQDLADLAPILDQVYEGHHGGYERGIGIGWSRGRSTSADRSSQTAEINALRMELQASKEDRAAMMARMLKLEQQVQDFTQRLVMPHSSAGAQDQRGSSEHSYH